MIEIIISQYHNIDMIKQSYCLIYVMLYALILSSMELYLEVLEDYDGKTLWKYGVVVL